MSFADQISNPFAIINKFHVFLNVWKCEKVNCNLLLDCCNVGFFRQNFVLWSILIVQRVAFSKNMDIDSWLTSSGHKNIQKQSWNLKLVLHFDHSKHQQCANSKGLPFHQNSSHRIFHTWKISGFLTYVWIMSFGPAVKCWNWRRILKCLPYFSPK